MLQIKDGAGLFDGAGRVRVNHEITLLSNLRPFSLVLNCVHHRGFLGLDNLGLIFCVMTIFDSLGNPRT